MSAPDGPEPRRNKRKRQNTLPVSPPPREKPAPSERRRSIKVTALHTPAFDASELDLPDYEQLSPIILSGDIISLRARSKTREGLPVFLKFSIEGRNDFATRAKQEVQILARLASAGIEEITRVIALETSHKYGCILVCEDLGVAPLPTTDFFRETARRIDAGQLAWDSKRLATFYDIAIQLVRLMGRIHQQNVRHGSLRTAITTLGIDGRTVRVGDFHFAYLADEETPKELGMREDVLCYLAPEATGRQSRACDRRTDFYSIGAIFYELLTSQPPFLDDDQLELVHQVMTRVAPLAAKVEPSVPIALAKLVAKLLEKNPTARYQRVEGILADLERLAAGSLVDIGHIDNQARYLIPTTLYARDAQALSLKQSYYRVRENRVAEVALVRGVSGVGKSALVETLQTAVTACQGYLTRAKFDQFKTTAPLFAIGTALEVLIRRICSESETDLQEWGSRLKNVIGQEGRMLASIVPLIEVVFGAGWLESQPPLPDLPPDQANSRLEALVKNIFRVFARSGKPLLIILDDLQWGSALDMDFITSMLAEREGLDMLICCIYRDNEVDATHLISSSLLPRVGKVDLEIDLRPFQLQHVIDFLGDALRRKVEVAGMDERECDDDLRALASLVMARSNGNPFFAHTILKMLYTSGALQYSFESLGWTWDIESIRAADLSPDVVDVLVAQIAKLAPDTQETLQVAACLGAESIDPAYLARALARPVVVVTHALDDARKAGLLDVGPDRSTNTSVPGSRATLPIELEAELQTALAEHDSAEVFNYRFLHDRVQQAAYSVMASDSVHPLHYQIGLRLRAGLSEAELSDRAFELCAQLNHGIDLAMTPEEREDLAYINILAGKSAVQMTAARSALGYLVTARDLLGPSSWTTSYKLAYSCYETLIDAEYASANYAMAQTYAEFSLKHVKSDLERLRLYRRSVRCATGTGNAPAAVRIGFDGLTYAGVNIPLDEAGAAAYADSLAPKVILNEQQVAELARLPRCTDSVVEEAHHIIAALVPPTYFSRTDLFKPMIFQSIHMTIEHGICPPGLAQFVTQGLLLAREHPRVALAFGKLALSLLDDTHPLACSAYKIFASHIQVWNEPIRETLGSFRKAISLGIDSHNGEYTGYGCCELVAYSLLGAEDLPSLEPTVKSYATLLKRFGQDISSLYVAVIHQVVLNFRGQSLNPVLLEGSAFKASDAVTLETRPLNLHYFLYLFFSMQLAIYFDDWSRARSLISSGRKYEVGAPGIVFEAFFCLLEALALLDDFTNTTEFDRERISLAVTRFEKLSAHQPENFTCSYLWLQAERARADNDRSSAHTLYDQAIDAAIRQGFIHRAACINERCAGLIGLPKMAAGYIIDAERFWRQWGCNVRANQIIDKFPHFFTMLSPNEIGSTSRRRSTISDYGEPPPLTSVPLNGRSSLSEAGSVEAGWDPLSVKFTDSKLVADPSLNSVTLPEAATDRLGSLRSVRSRGISHTPSAARLEESIDGDSSLEIVGVGGAVAASSLEKRSALGVELDMKTVLRASLAISEGLSVDSVVTKLMALVLRAAGAEVCHLILNKDGILCGEASHTTTSVRVQQHRHSASIETMPWDFPVSVVNYVARTKAHVMNDFITETPDPYLQRHKPKSILCLPLQNHTKLIGVLFLSNDQATHAFTSDRLELLRLVAAQAASAIERARLVSDLESANTDLLSHKKTLEEKVEQRTFELKDKNEKLQAQISERERAQTELRRARDEAESATAQKSLFLANMSHEIRTPFNAIVALSGLLLDSPLNPTQTDWIQTIRNSSSELLVVINDILDYSKIENGSLELQSEPFSLRSCIDGSLELLAEKAAAKNLDLAFVWHQNDERVIGDIIRLRQICVNYIGNAVKFTSEGQIIVRASTAVTDSKDKNDRPIVRIRISVEDTGTGISPWGLKKLFQLYSQVDGAETTSKFGGTGLGLSISKRLCEQMNGRAWAESKLGEGSTFFAEVYCPQAYDDATLQAPTPRSTFQQRRCLIVDKHEPTRDSLRFVVEGMGLTTEVASAWEEAFEMGLAAYQAGQSFDLIVVDAFLPAFGALSLLKKLRQRGASCKVIVLTRMGSPVPDELRAMSSDFIIKPVKQQTLIGAVRRLMTGIDPSAPVRANAEAASSEFPTVIEPSNLRLLCVDDNPINIKVIHTVLKRLGYNTVDTAQDGIEALEACARTRYDIVLLDVQMPRMNGLDASRELCRRYTVSERPYIIAMTANALSGDREKCEEAGMDSYISKPILIPDLIARLQKAASMNVQRKDAAKTLSAPSPPPALSLNKSALHEYRQRIVNSTAQSQSHLKLHTPSGSVQETS